MEYGEKRGYMSRDVSVLMSVYHREKPQYLDVALKSIWIDQTLTPKEIVLVKDGPLPAALEEVISKWLKTAGERLKIVPLETNCGLAVALNNGLAACTSDYVARMDTDDIALPARLETQVSYLEKNPSVDVVGSAMAEVDESGQPRNKIVKYPLSHDECFDLFRKRDPLAHPTVMFRKTFFEKAGIYDSSVRADEDSLLWMKGFNAGCRFANVPDVLLNFRVTSDFFKSRRSGVSCAMELFRNRLKIIDELDYRADSYVYAVLLLVVYLLPQGLKKFAYRVFR